MGAGKIIVLIGAILGILSIILYYFLPEVFCIWRFKSPARSIFIGGFGSSYGFLLGVEQEIHYSEEPLLFLIGFIVFIGSVIALVGAFLRNKGVAVLGGILTIFGPVLLLLTLGLELGDFEAIAVLLLPPGDNLFFGSSGGAEWGLYIGFFLTVGAGMLGIIGVAIID